MPARTAQLALLTYDQCYELLGAAPFCRVATSGALPLVAPVNFALDGHSIVFRTTADGQLAQATRGDCVRGNV